MKNFTINDEVREELKKIDQVKIEFKSDNKAGDCPGYLVKNGTKKGLVVLQGKKNFTFHTLKNGGALKKEFYKKENSLPLQVMKLLFLIYTEEKLQQIMKKLDIVNFFKFFLTFSRLW
jgi:hypothetical protein